jgi:hypothetical protein
MAERHKNRWSVAAFDREKGEFVHAWNDSYETVPDREELAEMLVRQAPPIRISPTRRKRPESASKTHLIFGDTHRPFANERRLELAQIAVRELMPDVILFTGDDVDMAEFSTFDTRPEWAGSAQAGIDQHSEYLAQTRANVGPDADIYSMMGNHDYRLERELRKYNGALMGLHRAGEQLPALSLEYLLRCAELGVQYVSGYPEAEVWLADRLKAYHGRRTSTASVVARELLDETVSFIHGHGHRGELLYRTMRQGRVMQTIFGMQVGSFADLSTTPSGKTSKTERGKILPQGQNWDSSMGLVFEHDDGTLEPHLIPINDEGIRLFGKTYKS